MGLESEDTEVELYLSNSSLDGRLFLLLSLVRIEYKATLSVTLALVDDGTHCPNVRGVEHLLGSRRRVACDVVMLCGAVWFGVA